MVHVVGVGDMRLVDSSGEILVTSPIGMGIALALTDPVAKVAGILHFMLPASDADSGRAADHPCLFADTGIPLFLRAATAMGAAPPHMKLSMAGGAQPVDPTSLFAIGMRNQVMARKILWKSGLSIEREHVGGTRTRTMRLETGPCRTWLLFHDGEQEL
ncbi:MAG: chemotaxis protein CheD [Candidatus Eisenbacteria bacterium]